MSGIWLVSYIILWLLVLLLSVVLLSVLRTMGVLLDRLNYLRGPAPEPLKLQVGAPLPELLFHTLDGMPATLPHAPTTLIIVSPGCAPCHALLRDLARNEYSVLPVVISTGDADETRTAQDETSLSPDVAVRLADYEALRHTWGVSSTPTTITLDAHGSFVRHAVGYNPASPALIGTAND